MIHVAGLPLWAVGNRRRPAFDSFIRADSSTTLGTADSGQAWETHNGSTWGIDDNQAYAVVQGGTEAPIATVDSRRSDGILLVQLSVIDPQPSTGFLLFRFVDVDNYYIWGGNQSGNPLALIRRTAGVFETLAATTPGLVADDVIGVALDGPTIRCFLGGALKFTATNQTQGLNATRHGLYVSTAPVTTRFSAFRAA